MIKVNRKLYINEKDFPKRLVFHGTSSKIYHTIKKSALDFLKTRPFNY